MIRLVNVSKTYRRGAEEVRALRAVSLEIRPAEFVSVIGPSGSGKTTLLQILGCLDTPTSGTVFFDNIEVDSMAEKQLVALRRERIGFIFQQFHLIPGLTVFDNIALPLLFARKKIEQSHILELAERVGLEGRLNHVPAQLSGGEMQRTAIARALVNSPEIILADEPTGNLDSVNSDRIFGILQELNQTGLTIVMITHNNELAARAGRSVQIRDGNIFSA